MKKTIERQNNCSGKCEIVFLDKSEGGFRDHEGLSWINNQRKLKNGMKRDG